MERVKVARTLSMLYQIEFIFPDERVVGYKRCLTPADECLNPLKRNTL